MGKETIALHDAFAKLINDYHSVYSQVVKTGDWKNPFRELISKTIPEAIETSADITPPYTVVGSYGKGRWTSVPWVAVFDTRITSSAQQGVYIVYTSLIKLLIYGTAVVLSKTPIL